MDVRQDWVGLAVRASDGEPLGHVGQLVPDVAGQTAVVVVDEAQLPVAVVPTIRVMVDDDGLVVPASATG